MVYRKGNLIANNLYGTGQVDIDQGLFTGFPAVAAPDPATYLIMGTMLGFILIAASYRNKLSLLN